MFVVTIIYVLIGCKDNILLYVFAIFANVLWIFIFYAMIFCKKFGEE